MLGIVWPQENLSFRIPKVKPIQREDNKHVLQNIGKNELGATKYGQLPTLIIYDAGNTGWVK